MKRRVIAVLAAAGIVIFGWLVYRKTMDSGEGSGNRRDNPPVAVEVEAVRKTDIREVGSFTGTLYPLSEFVVAPKIAGRLEKILVNIGDAVEGGQLVAVLDDDEYRQQVIQAKAELEVAQANLQERRNTLENSRREYERTMALREKKIASESELDAAESQYQTQQAQLKVAHAQLAQKEAALKMAEVRLSYARIQVAQNNGDGNRVVGERFVDEGAMLAPNTPIVSVLDIGTLTAVIHVIERDYSKIQPNLEAVAATDAFPGRSFLGRVVRIAPMLKEKSREARVEIEIPNDEKLLKPGMFVKVQIQFGRHENVTVVPSTAVVKRDGKAGVFLVDRPAKKARFVPVTIGVVNDGQAEVLDPVLSGEVVTLGHHLLEDGAAVILPEPKAAGGPSPDAAPPSAAPDSGPDRGGTS
jgi:RND family efflux transporter MFP subunit